MGVEVELVSDDESEQVWLWKSEVPSEHGLTLVKVSSHADADYSMKWSIEVHAQDFNKEAFFSYGMDMEGTESSARLGIEVLRAPSKYRLLEAKLASIRLAHGDSESKEEDACLDEMDVVWLRLCPEERDKLNAPSRKVGKVATGICGPAGARHCPWCKAAADKFQNEKGDVLWHCHACYWTHTEARLLYIEMAEEMNRSAPKFPALGTGTGSISSAELGDDVRMKQIYGSDRKPK
jgi:hypothetical protein